MNFSHHAYPLHLVWRGILSCCPCFSNPPPKIGTRSNVGIVLCLILTEIPTEDLSVTNGIRRACGQGLFQLFPQFSERILEPLH